MPLGSLIPNTNQCNVLAQEKDKYLYCETQRWRKAPQWLKFQRDEVMIGWLLVCSTRFFSGVNFMQCRSSVEKEEG